MLSPLKIAETIEIPYSGAIPTQPLITFDLQPGIPYNLSHIVFTITATTGIVLSSLFIRDENANFIYSFTFIPFLAAGTSATSTLMQTPDPPLTGFFGPALAGFIPADFYVFNGWNMRFFDFLATPGVSLDAIITLTRSVIGNK